MKPLAVIGGGITGVTTAHALARHGFAVTLFERNRYAAMDTSFANGGQAFNQEKVMSARGPYQRHAQEFKIQLCQDIRSSPPMLPLRRISDGAAATLISLCGN